MRPRQLQRTLQDHVKALAPQEDPQQDQSPHLRRLSEEVLPGRTLPGSQTDPQRHQNFPVSSPGQRLEYVPPAAPR